MKVHAFIALLISFVIVSSATADTNILFETFDSYADQAAFENVWRPDAGSGYEPNAGPNGILVPNTGVGLIPPNDDPPGIQGQAANVLLDINEYDDDNNTNTEPFQLVPSATQSVQYSGDIFDDAVGNKRISIGLRNDTVQRAFGVFGYNFVEMGYYNANATDPTDGTTIIPSTDFAYRVTLFDSSSIGPPLVQTPDWQYFPLDPSLDTSGDGLVSSLDVGVGWHHYSATIGVDSITLELDLYRDGLANTEPTEGVGNPGVDSSVTWAISPTNVDTGDAFDFDPFTSLRIGSPSGVDSAFEAVIDNVSLDMVDVPMGSGADFDANSVVNFKDFLIWQSGFGLTGQTDNSNGDADGDGSVTGLDFAEWESQLGGPPPLTGAFATSVIPEPSSATLGLLASVGLALLARSRRQYV